MWAKRVDPNDPNLTKAASADLNKSGKYCFCGMRVCENL